jgi:hypothetical protein
MSRKDPPGRPRPEFRRPHAFVFNDKAESPYSTQGNREPVRVLGEDRKEHKDREGRFEKDNEPLDYDDTGRTGRRGRSSSPAQSPRREEAQGYRRRSRDQSYSRSLSPEYRPRRRDPEACRDQDTQRGRRGFSDRWRPPGPPYRHYNAGYTITDHNNGKSIECGPEYFMKPEVLQDVMGRYGPGDVVSVRYSDFSYDNQAEIGPQFTLSSEGKIYIKKDVPFILFKV